MSATIHVHAREEQDLHRIEVVSQFTASLGKYPVIGIDTKTVTLSIFSSDKVIDELIEKLTAYRSANPLVIEEEVA